MIGSTRDFTSSRAVVNTSVDDNTHLTPSCIKSGL